MRDLLPEEAGARRSLARQLLECFALHGYAVVTPPVFEFSEVLERGLGTLAPTDVLRFVEPESGEVAALRPDMTPQIARMIATRLSERPPPFRLGYEGTVLRRRSGRGPGVAGPEGDLELLALAVTALRGAGLDRLTLDIGDAGVVRALLAPLSPELQSAISDALARKDAAAVAAACVAVPAPHADALRALPALHGRRDALLEGVRRLSSTPAAGPAKRLLALFDAAVACGLGPDVSADLGEVRGFAYYTGTIFHVYAPGTGDAMGSGGRYDELLARFGWDLPAAGFALDLDRVGEALLSAGVVSRQSLRVVVVGVADDSRISELRKRGIAAVAAADKSAALGWARAWGFSHVLDASGWVDVATGASIASPLGDEAKQ